MKLYDYVVFADLLGTGTPERIKETIKAGNSEGAKVAIRDKYLNQGKLIDIYDVVRCYRSGRRKLKTAVIIPFQVLR